MTGAASEWGGFRFLRAFKRLPNREIWDDFRAGADVHLGFLCKSRFRKDDVKGFECFTEERFEITRPQQGLPTDFSS
jgi:hypothetical protein